MTQEEKELLSKDLSSRLFYGVICHANKINIDGELLFVNKLYNILALYCDNAIGKFESCPINDIRPYLRPMSSMTEEERREFSVFIGKTEVYVQQIRLDADSMANPIIGGNKCVYWGLFDRCIDWLNKKMFDYRGLIEKGLAIEAPEGMYNLEKK